MRYTVYDRYTDQRLATEVSEAIYEASSMISESAHRHLSGRSINIITERDHSSIRYRRWKKVFVAKPADSGLGLGPALLAMSVETVHGNDATLKTLSGID